MIADLIGGTKVAACQEERIQKLMLAYVTAKRLTLVDLYRLANVAAYETVADDAVIYGLDLEVLISIFCSRDKNFDAAYIKDQYKALQIFVLNCHKLYMTLDMWRIAVLQQEALREQPALDSGSDDETNFLVTVDEEMLLLLFLLRRLAPRFSHRYLFEYLLIEFNKA